MVPWNFQLVPSHAQATGDHDNGDVSKDGVRDITSGDIGEGVAVAVTSRQEGVTGGEAEHGNRARVHRKRGASRGRSIDRDTVVSSPPFQALENLFLVAYIFELTTRLLGDWETCVQSTWFQVDLALVVHSSSEGSIVLF